jgi:hypothetical protein
MYVLVVRAEEGSLGSQRRRPTDPSRARHYAIRAPFFARLR